MSQALYRKWRPARFDDVIGQEHVTRTLRNAVVAGRVGHAYLFCGPRGTGKTTTARLLAKAVNCLHDDPAERPCNQCRICTAIRDGRYLDLIEIDAASNTGVDDIRGLRDKINFAPSDGTYKVYIIDEVHMLSTAAFNALLKTLEEPPPHAIFVLATTEEHKVPLTIKSRCQQFNFRLLTTQEIEQRLRWIAEQESLTIEDEALSLLARHGAGSIRDAESLLDQLVTAPGDAITLERSQMVLGTATTASIVALTQAWLRADGSGGLRIIHDALSVGTDARQFCRQMVAHLRRLLLVQTGGQEVPLDLPDEEQEMLHAVARQADRRALIETIKRFNEAALAPANAWQPQLPLELAFIDSLPEQPQVTADWQPPAPRSEQQPAQSEPVAAPPPRAAKKSAAEPDLAPGPTAPEKAAPPAPEPVAERSPEPPAEKKESAVPTASAGFDMAAVRTRWQELVDRCGRHDRNLPPLLAMCQPLAVEDQTLVLGFQYPILRDKFDQEPHVALVSDVLGELMEQTCRVRAVVTDEYTPPAPPISRDEFEALADELGGVVRDSS